MDWLLLIHQIPAKPAYLRAKIGRRLQQLGAVAIKQSVYAMPRQEQALEDLTWIVKEIADGGGEATMIEARFLEGLSDQQVIGLFHAARGSDYTKILTEARALRDDWHCQVGESAADCLLEFRGQLEKLRKQFTEVVRIDFFKAPEQLQAEAALRDLETTLIEHRTTEQTTPDRSNGIVGLSGKTWVTRKNVYVDRITCAWLVRRYADPDACFKFVDSNRYSPSSEEIRFDMTEAEYTHVMDKCSFEVMVERFGITDPALAQVSKIIHDIDLKESAFGLPETAGIQALLDGITATTDDDLERIEQASTVLDGLLTFFKNKH
ncbi:MAG: chromate resistance protein [Deltaproteobacteria bacterium]|nr:chromate resistance protein [Deltaproteobacteria bacterium]